MEAEDIDQMLTLYSLGQLDPASRALLDERLASDPELGALAAEFRDVTARFMVDNSPHTAPPPALKSRILDLVDTVPARVNTDAEGRITAINSSFCALCGHSFEELRGKKPGQVLQGPETDPVAAQNLSAAIRRAEECSEEILNYHKDGSTYRARIHIRPIRSEDGELTGFLGEAHKL